MLRKPQLLHAVQILHSLAVAAIIAMICVWEVINLFHQLFPAK